MPCSKVLKDSTGKCGTLYDTASAVIIHYHGFGLLVFGGPCIAFDFERGAATLRSPRATFTLLCKRHISKNTFFTSYILVVILDSWSSVK